MELGPPLQRRLAIQPKPSNHAVLSSHQVSHLEGSRDSQAASSAKAQLIEQHEGKRWNHLLQQLPEQLASPYKEKRHAGRKKLSKRQRNDPVRKIILTNKNIAK
jgi:hypothetical protein